MRTSCEAVGTSARGSGRRRAVVRGAGALGFMTALMLVGLVPLAQAADPLPRAWLQEGQIHTELTGLKLAGIYPSHIAWSETIGKDGTTQYEEGNERRPGHWSIAGELFCFVYAQPHQGGCFRVVKHSPNCYELYTASIGGVAPATPPPANAMSWNGRMWRDGERATCEDKIVS